MPNLESLTLTGNKIAALPGDMVRCERLATLYAGANDIVDATPAFEPPGIIHAGLAHNKIEKLPSPEILAGADAMLSLDLTHNNLTSLPDVLDALSRMPALRSLSLAGNPLALVPGYKAAILSVLPELQILDGERVEGDGDAEPTSAADAPNPETVTLQIAVTDVTVAADPVPPPATPEVKEGETGAEAEAEAEADEGAGGDGEATQSSEDTAVFCIQYSLSGCGDEGLTVPIRTPKTRRTPPAHEDEAAAAEAEGEDAEIPPVDGHVTFVATLPVTAATRDMLHGGINFELFRVEMVPVPVPPPRAAEGEAGEVGEGSPEGGEEEESEGTAAAAPEEGDAGAEGEGGEEEGDKEPEMEEKLTLVGSATVKLGALLAGDATAITAPVSFVPGLPMFGEALVGEVLLPIEGQPEQPSRGAATVTFTLHVPPPQEPEPEPLPEDGEGVTEEA